MLGKTFMALLFGTMLSMPSAQAATFDKDGNLVLENDAPISVSGVITAFDGDEFLLDYGGENNVTVDLENWDNTDDFAELIKPGARVSVTGMVEDNLFEFPEIDADAIKLEDSNTLITVTGISKDDSGNVVREIEPAAGNQTGDKDTEDGAYEMEQDESNFIENRPEWGGYDGEDYP